MLVGLCHAILVGCIRDQLLLFCEKLFLKLDPSTCIFAPKGTHEREVTVYVIAYLPLSCMLSVHTYHYMETARGPWGPCPPLCESRSYRCIHVSGVENQLRLVGQYHLTINILIHSNSPYPDVPYLGTSVYWAGSLQPHDVL